MKDFIRNWTYLEEKHENFEEQLLDFMSRVVPPITLAEIIWKQLSKLGRKTTRNMATDGENNTNRNDNVDNNSMNLSAVNQSDYISVLARGNMTESCTMYDVINASESIDLPSMRTPSWLNEALENIDS